MIDAAGKYVFPGFIDPHVHIYLPFMGTFAKDTYDTASRAALVGGTTTLIEMVCPSRADEPLDAYELWKSKAAGRSACDYAFHMGVTRFDDTTARGPAADRRRRHRVVQSLPGLQRGVWHRRRRALPNAGTGQTLGVIVTAHCENAEVVAQLQRQLLAEGKTGPEWHEPSRPTAVEAEGVHHLATFAGLTGAHVYVVHTSCEEALAAAQAAQNRGVRMWVETVAPYLVLDKTYAERPNFEGAKYVMSPPLRDIRHQHALWNALRTGLVSTVATDHAPFDFDGQKEMGRGDFTKIPNGIPSVEDRVHLLYTHGVATGRIDLHRFVDAAARRPPGCLASFRGRGRFSPAATRTSWFSTPPIAA